MPRLGVAVAGVLNYKGHFREGNTRHTHTSKVKRAEALLIGLRIRIMPNSRHGLDALRKPPHNRKTPRGIPTSPSQVGVGPQAAPAPPQVRHSTGLQSDSTGRPAF